jgi:glycosyltransferase involved in cell wall biosynthesis
VRVALVHYTCPPVVGGVETLLRAHAGLLADAGHVVTVFAGRGRTFDRRVPVTVHPELDSKHPEVLAVGAELAAGAVTSRFHALQDRLLAWWREALAPFDVAIVHNAFTLHFNLPLTAALHAAATPMPGVAGLRLVAWCHDLAWTNPLYTPLLREAFPWTLLKTCHPAVRYVVVSRDRQIDLARLAGVPREQVAVIPGGVDLADWFRFTPATRRLLRTLRLRPDETVLLLPARLTRRKNVELAVRVVAALRDLGARPRLLVTGPPGPHDPRSLTYLAELQALCRALGVERQVAFLYRARLSGAAVADLYQVADVLFFPSRQEGFGLPLLEASLARLPVFCSALPPFQEVAGDAVTYFAPDDSPEAIARRLVEFLARDPATRLRRRVRRLYSWDTLYARLIAPLLVGAPVPDLGEAAEAGDGKAGLTGA